MGLCNLDGNGGGGVSNGAMFCGFGYPESCAYVRDGTVVRASWLNDWVDTDFGQMRLWQGDQRVAFTINRPGEYILADVNGYNVLSSSGGATYDNVTHVVSVPRDASITVQIGAIKPGVLVQI